MSTLKYFRLRVKPKLFSYSDSAVNQEILRASRVEIGLYVLDIYNTIHQQHIYLLPLIYITLTKI